jgi:hypothetical protein
LSACGEEIEPRSDTGDVGDADDLRLGRVHVVLEPGDAAVSEDEDHLRINARFAFFRGLDEEFVRTQIDMPVLPHDQVPRSQCMTDELLRSVDVEPGDGPDRELVLVDAGDMQVHAGESTLHVPLALVPDLLPYMSGVQYEYDGEPLPSTDTEGVASLVVEADGSPGDELPAFSVEGALPEAPAIYFADEDLDDLARDALVLRWNESDDPEQPIALRMTPLVGGEPIGDAITCVFDDVGRTRVDMQWLYTLGLSRAADTLAITASRVSTAVFDAGPFAGSELVIERRSATTVPLP